MRFCAHHSHDLDAAWAALPASSSADATKNPPATVSPRLPAARALTPLQSLSTESLVAKTAGLSISSPKLQEEQQQHTVRPPAAELSTLLMSLRKLREAILSTASTTPIPFAQRTHAFSIRFSILARHPPSYFPSLRYLLDDLHSATHPLTASERMEFTSYLILDYACRQNDLAVAYALLVHAKAKYNFACQTVDRVLAALTHDNWVLFWRTHKAVDGYVRAVMTWATEHVTRQALKAIGRTYMTVNSKWLVASCTGNGDWTWERLAEKEKLGWQKEGDSVVIRKPRVKT